MSESGFKSEPEHNNVDLMDKYVTKSYMLDHYADVIPTARVAGLWGSGLNNLGQLGTNNTTFRSSPVQTVASGTAWKDVAGDNFTIAIKADGTLWTWGNNTAGQLGQNHVNNTSSPAQTVAGGNTWKKVDAGYSVDVGYSSSVALKTDGTLWTWGINTYGELGTNTSSPDSRSSPTQTVAGGTDWVDVAMCCHTIGIKSDGTLWIWGSDSNGALGTNTYNVHKSSPVQTVAGGTNWVTASCGLYFSGAIKSDGTLWMWGTNQGGVLGNNSTASVSSPTQTVAGTDWKRVSCGTGHTAAIKTNGTLWAWGWNGVGAIGDNTNVSKSSPVQTVASGTNWKFVECTLYVTSAIKTDGTLWRWGYDGYGTLGVGGGPNRSSPVQVGTQTTWTNLLSGGTALHTFAIKDHDLE